MWPTDTSRPSVTTDDFMMRSSNRWFWITTPSPRTENGPTRTRSNSENKVVCTRAPEPTWQPISLKATLNSGDPTSGPSAGAASVSHAPLTTSFHHTYGHQSGLITGPNRPMTTDLNPATANTTNAASTHAATGNSRHVAVSDKVASAITTNSKAAAPAARAMKPGSRIRIASTNRRCATSPRVGSNVTVASKPSTRRRCGSLNGGDPSHSV